mmetsp:Transcript_41068/g.103485  ORF Transcript_41068/g.103485 Transcript_41068/m.103485 type:complete len:317 (+) Transcript_41068:902-1852(+)
MSIGMPPQLGEHDASVSSTPLLQGGEEVTEEVLSRERNSVTENVAVTLQRVAVGKSDRTTRLAGCTCKLVENRTGHNTDRSERVYRHRNRFQLARHKDIANDRISQSRRTALTRGRHKESLDTVLGESGSTLHGHEVGLASRPCFVATDLQRFEELGQETGRRREHTGHQCQQHPATTTALRLEVLRGALRTQLSQNLGVQRRIAQAEGDEILGQLVLGAVVQVGIVAHVHHDRLEGNHRGSLLSRHQSHRHQRLLDRLQLVLVHELIHQLGASCLATATTRRARAARSPTARRCLRVALSPAFFVLALFVFVLVR